MKILALAAALLCVNSHGVRSEDRPPLRERVQEFIGKHKTPDSLEAAFKEWSAREPQNPDPYIFAANAYQAAAEIIVINTDTKRDGFAITDPKTGKQVGTLGSGADPKIQMKGRRCLRRLP